MRTKFLAAATAAAALTMATGTAHADWWIPYEVVGSDGVTVQGSDHITFTTFSTTVDPGDTVVASLEATTDVGRSNYGITVTFSGDCGPDAAVTPDFVNLDFDTQNPFPVELTVTGLSYVGTGVCSIDFGTSVNGKPFKENGVVVITINAPEASTSTTTTTVAEATTTTAAEATTTTAAESAAVPEAGSNSTSLAVMALGFVLLGWATVAGTRRRHSA